MDQNDDYVDGKPSDLLEMWLSSPMFWDDESLCKFFVEGYNSIKDLKDFKSFDENVTFKSTKNWNLWGSHDNWKEVLGEEHFNLVILIHDRNGKVIGTTKKTETVLDLLSIIRNKHQHNEHYETSQKLLLGWYQKSENKLLFCEKLYGKYWRTKFPHLELYFWTQFWQLESTTIQKYYPTKYSCLNLRSLKLIDNMRLTSFAEDFQAGLIEQKNQGFLVSRILLSSNSSETTVELHSIPFQLNKRLLKGHRALFAAIFRTGTRCWYDNTKINGERLTLSQVENEIVRNLFLVVTNRIADLNVNVMYDAWCWLVKQHFSGKIILLISQDVKPNSELEIQFQEKMDSFAKKEKSKISDMPLQWSELSQECRARVEKSGKVAVQGREILLSELVQRQSIKKNFNGTFLTHLSGRMLNKLLKGETLPILQSLNLPQKPKYYLQRKLQKLVLIKAEILPQTTPNDVFIICDICEEEFGKLVQFKVLTSEICRICRLEDISLAKSKYIICDRSFALTTDENLAKLPFPYTAASKNFHFLCYIKYRAFHLKYSNGSTSVFVPLTPDFASQREGLSDSDFTNSFRAFRKLEKLVLIIGQPGMGKSLLLRTLARNFLKDNFSIIIYMEARTLVKLLSQDKDVVTTLQNLLASEKFEKTLINILLTSEWLKHRFCIFLDGLDELSPNDQIKIMQLIQNFFQCRCISRVLVTAREFMLSQIWTKFPDCIHVYRLLSFSKNDQISCLVTHWKNYWCGKGKDILDLDIERLEKLASKLIAIPFTGNELEITGVPLQCMMLAEIYETDVFDENFLATHNRNNLAWLYEQLILRKLAVYINEKNLLNLPMEHPLVRIMIENIEYIHFYFSIKLCISEDVATKLKDNLIITSLSKNELCVLPLEVGLLSSVDPVTFAHQTFAEFNLAKFVHKAIICQFPHLSYDNITIQDMLWNEILQAEVEESVQPTYYTCNSCTFKNLAVCHFLNQLLESNNKFSDLTKFKVVYELVIDLYISRPWFKAQLIANSPKFAASVCTETFNLSCLIIQNKQEIVGLFITALKTNHLQLVNSLVDCSGELSQFLEATISFKSCGNSALHYVLSAPFNYMDMHMEDAQSIVKYLLKIDKSLLETTNLKGETPLLYLARRCNDDEAKSYKDLLQFLVGLGANVSACCYNGESILHMDRTTKFRHELLKDFFAEQYFNVWRIAHSKGCSHINQIDDEGYTPLARAMHLTSCSKHLAISLPVFRKYDENFNALVNGKTLLHFALEQKADANVCYNLVECGANMLHVNELGLTAFDFAVRSKHGSLILTTVGHFYDYYKNTENAVNFIRGHNLLHSILKAVCDENLLDFGGKKLHSSIEARVSLQELKRFITLLLSKDEKLLEERDEQSRTPLLCLLQQEICIYDIEWKLQVVIHLVRLFVEDLKADVNVADNLGNTVLHFTDRVIPFFYKSEHSVKKSIIRKNQETYLLLYEHYCNVGLNWVTKTAKNRDGETPLQKILKLFEPDEITNDGKVMAMVTDIVLAVTQSMGKRVLQLAQNISRN